MNRTRSLDLFNRVFSFPGCPDMSDWIRRGLQRRLLTQRLVMVSALCPDYEIVDQGDSYRKYIGSGVPHRAPAHLEFMSKLHRTCQEYGIALSYWALVADTEADFPMIVESVAGGSISLFLERCQASCEAVALHAQRMGFQNVVCTRTTELFPDWKSVYEHYLASLRSLATKDSGVEFSLTVDAINRLPKYKALTGGQALSIDDAKQMVLCYRAQYAAWGSCVSNILGDAAVMLNHVSPYLSWVNYERKLFEKERIPIIQL